jgi:hypothetical protein
MSDADAMTAHQFMTSHPRISAGWTRGRICSKSNVYKEERVRRNKWPSYQELLSITKPPGLSDEVQVRCKLNEGTISTICFSIRANRVHELVTNSLQQDLWPLPSPRAVSVLSPGDNNCRPPAPFAHLSKFRKELLISGSRCQHIFADRPEWVFGTTSRE